MKKITFLSALLIMICSFSTAQELRQEVFATASESMEGSEIYSGFTIGEIITETLSNDVITLTQGFHQENYIVVEVNENEYYKPIYQVYPNPFINTVTIESIHKDKRIGTVIVYDSEGKILFNEQVQKNSYHINFCKYPSGTYILLIKNESELTKYKIIKR